MVAKWTSVSNHIQNVHQNDDWRFPQCLHQPVDANGQRKWLKPSSMPCELLSDIIHNKKLLADIAKMSNHHQTASIEAFHSLILSFAPKLHGFSYMGLLCRTLLAAMHYNDNADRPQAMNSAGQLMYNIRFPKYKKGDFSVVPVKGDPVYNYVDNLLCRLFTDVVNNKQEFQQLVHNITVPPSLCSEYHHPNPSEAIENFTSRFSRKQHD